MKTRVPTVRVYSRQVWIKYNGDTTHVKVCLQDLPLVLSTTTWTVKPTLRFSVEEERPSKKNPSARCDTLGKGKGKDGQIANYDLHPASMSVDNGGYRLMRTNHKHCTIIHAGRQSGLMLILIWVTRQTNEY